MQSEAIDDPIAEDPTERLRLDAMGEELAAGEESAAPGPTSQELEQFLAAAREKLDGLVGGLRAIDVELEDLAPDRKQHLLLQGLCSAFDQLNEAGAAALFWGDDHPQTNIEERLRAARAKVSAFDERIGAIEARRRAQLDAINEQQEHAAWLEDDVFEALEEEERIKHEWIVEREIDAIRAAQAMDSWTQGGEDDRRFRKTATNALLACSGVRADPSVHSAAHAGTRRSAGRTGARDHADGAREAETETNRSAGAAAEADRPGQAGRKGRAAEGRETGRAGAEARRRARSGARHSRVSREARFVQGRAGRGARFKGEDQQCRRIIRATAAVDADDKRARVPAVVSISPR